MKKLDVPGSVAEKDFPQDMIMSLAKYGVRIVEATWLPSGIGTGGARVYLINDNGRQRVWTHREVIKHAKAWASPNVKTTHSPQGKGTSARQSRHPSKKGAGIQVDPGEWWDSLSSSDRQTAAEHALVGSAWEEAVLWLPGRTWKTIRPDAIREALWKGLSSTYPTRRSGHISR